VKVLPVNVYAYTATGQSYPSYISVNEGVGDAVSFTVRSKADVSGAYPVCGGTAEMELSRAEARALALAILRLTDE